MNLHHLIPASLFDYKRRRPSSTARGYNAKWKAVRRAFLAVNGHCLYCLQEGRINPSECIDHNPPHRGDRAAFWDTARWIPCCEHHNNRFGAGYDGAFNNPIRPRPPAPLRTSIVIPEVPYKERPKRQGVK
jgi:5-methylcytosine-specific restriction endonuclease McrA